MAERTVGEKRADPLRRNRLQDAFQMHHVIALICIIWQCPPHPIMQSDIILSDLWEGILTWLTYRLFVFLLPTKPQRVR